MKKIIILILGEFMLNIGIDELMKKHDITPYDEDIVIERDVWLGANVTLLKGVTIGRGAIVDASSVIVKNISPYSIFGGVPAKFIKYKWGVAEIIKHEKIIYKNESERLSEVEIINYFEKFSAL